MLPRFSIILPVCNGEKYLPECLDSVLAQRFGNWECLCVDDASTDGTLPILEEYSDRDARFRIFINLDRKGVSASRNRALDAAQGEYVAFLDADDAISSNWLARADEIIAEENPDLLRFAFLAWHDGAPRPAVKEEGPIETIKRGGVIKWGWRTLLCGGHSWLLFVRRQAVAGVRFPESLAVREDVVFAMDLLPNIAKACMCSYMGYWYRMHGDSAWHKARALRDALNFPMAAVRIFDGQSSFVPGREERSYYVRSLLNNLQEWVMLAAKEDRKHDASIIAATLEALSPVGYNLEGLGIGRLWRIALCYMERRRSLLMVSLLVHWSWGKAWMKRRVKFFARSLLHRIGVNID